MACNTHFYYKNNNEKSCDRIGSDSVIIDSTAWPSSYYGRTKRIDLAKVYSDTLLRINQEQEQKHHQQQQRNKKGRRQVSFTTAPPIIHEYEREDIREYCRNRKRYDDAGHLRIQTLDLRPIPNNCYNKQRPHRHQRSVSSPPTSPLVSPNYSLASPISSSSSSSSPTKSLSKSLQEQQSPTSSLSLPKTSISTTTTKKPSKKLRVDYDKQTTNDEENNILLLLLLKQPIRTRSFNISTFLNFKSFKMK
ncbi:hypothetical protein INT45_003076 [Circinella minor]|uniref:Uncharacterized protein n=1 Tax=Circinella minor TaxID=1195481 RepID=A0A8H7RZP7_9FUNG|nr:hypothetical protein INT45_003076 [Circinella minor]